MAVAVLEDKLVLNALIRSLPDDYEDYDDPVAELMDLLIHEPQVGGLLGVSQKLHDQHMARVLEIIQLLQA